MIVFGMTGPIGHGKSTFAKAIKLLEPKTMHFESSMIVAEVANALHSTSQQLPSRDDLDKINNWLKVLPEIITNVMHCPCTFDQVKLDLIEVQRHPIEYEKLFLHIENLQRRPELLTQQITPENKEEYRPILQWLGGYLQKKVNPDIWYNEIVRRIKQLNPEEYALCIAGGLRFPADERSLRSIGGKIIKVYRPGHLQYDMLDPTERERDNVNPDSIIVSNGTIEDLNACAKRVLDDLRQNKLEKTYYAVQQPAQ